MNTQEETKASEANSEEEYEDDFNEIVEKVFKDQADLEEDRIEEDDNGSVNDVPQKPENSALLK